MGDVIYLPVIAGVQISTDAEGRFNLSALHRASGLGKHKSPNKWLENKSTQELVKELSQNYGLGPDFQAPNSGLGPEPQGRNTALGPINTIHGGNAPGTFAHELLAISYAGWISPSFQLKVNKVFIDYQMGKLATAQQPTRLSRVEILNLALEAEHENQLLTAQLNEVAPKAEALDRIANSDGSLCITDAAKDLQMRPRDLFAWLSEHKWIYRRAGGSGWIAYQDRIQTGLLEHKVTLVSRGDGSEKTTEQVRVTPKGLTVLAEKLVSKVA